MSAEGENGILTPGMIRKELGCGRLLAEALIRRGVTTTPALRAYLKPSITDLSDPYQMQGMTEAVGRIRRAVESRERICVYGDYDADGVCATAILLRALKRLGADTMFYIPSRQREGYGMHGGALLLLKEQGVQLIVTVDNGVSAAAEIAYADSLGMDVVVTDHHILPPEIPTCCAVLHPSLGAATAHDLCGAGVAMKLATALTGENTDGYSLALAAVATVADMVPLIDENRAIVKLGMEKITGVIGLRAMLEQDGDHTRESVPNERDIAFIIAPRLNAAGRVGNASDALMLLLSEQRNEAADWALRLDQANADRKKSENDILFEIERGGLTRKDTAVLTVGEGWNVGVIGIVAARLTERYHMPAVVFSLNDGVLTGSARSYGEIDLYAAVKAAERFLIRFGGHAGAAGLSLTVEALDEFANAFCAQIKAQADAGKNAQPVAYEATESLRAMCLSDVAELEQLRPFGEGNEAPVYRIHAHVDRAQTMGRSKEHLSCVLSSAGMPMRAVQFGMGKSADAMMQAPDRVFYAVPRINRFGGREEVELFLGSTNACSDDPVERKKTDAIFTALVYNDCRSSSQTRERTDDLFHGLETDVPRLRADFRSLMQSWGNDAVPVTDVRCAADVQTAFAIAVFWELGFIRLEAGRLRLLPPFTKRDLNESATYAKALEVNS